MSPRRFSGYPTPRGRVDTLRRPGVQRACGQPEGGWRAMEGGRLMSRLRMWKSAWVLRAAGLSAIVVASAVSAPVVASAAVPDRGTVSSHEVFVDSDVCAPEGFSVDVVQDEVNTFTVFFDRSGEVARISVHTDYRAVITANGHTIIERDKWMDVFNADGTARTVGDTVHIQGPGGGRSSTMPGRSTSTPTGLSPLSTVRIRSSRARRSASRCCHSRGRWMRRRPPRRPSRSTTTCPRPRSRGSCAPARPRAWRPRVPRWGRCQAARSGFDEIRLPVSRPLKT